MLERTERLGGTDDLFRRRDVDPEQPAHGRGGHQGLAREALTYLRTLTSGFVPASMLETFVDSANEMIEFFETTPPST